MRTVHFSVGLVSAAILAYEVLLIRLFAIIQWHHFAYMVISIALLGFGASGTFLFLTRNRLRAHFTAAFTINAALFGLVAPGAFIIAQMVPFNALAVMWQSRELLHLAMLYGLLIVPFFVGANCIGLALMRFEAGIGSLYGANLLGSGLGSLAVIGALTLLMPSDALRLVAGMGLAAAALASWGGGSRRWSLALVVAAIALPLVLPAAWIAPRISPYKGLSGALAMQGTEVVGEVSGPLGLLTVVRSPDVPFRHVPGLSLNALAPIPEQLAVFTDGEGMSVITRFDGNRDSLEALDFTPSALPYHLLKAPAVLVLGAGGGIDILQAVFHRARSIDAAELDPHMARLVAETHGDFAGGLLQRHDVRLHIAEARAFVATSQDRWDLIQMPMLESASTAAAGVHGLAESYIYTVEALEAYLDRLRPGGILAITRWLKLPPRDSLKLFATARDALLARGIRDPSRHLVLLRGWNTTTLLLREAEFSAADGAAIRAFATERSFDLAWYPGMKREEANQFNILDEPYFHDGAVALLAGNEIMERYKFDLRPATDDQPYFFDFFKWRSVPEFLSLGRNGGVQLLELAYPILLGTLAQAVLLSVMLILLPLLPLLFHRASRWPAGGSGMRVLGYFAALGLAFLFVEIVFIQRFVLFLGHPLYATAVVLCAFLVFAGLGSMLGEPLTRRLEGRVDPIILAAVAITLLSAGYIALLPALFTKLIGLPIAAKIALSLGLIAPLALFMGMPFPLGLSRLSKALPDLVPWAWGVNGCFSVLSAVLATLLAIHFGFTMVVALAALLYLSAALLLRKPLIGSR